MFGCLQLSHHIITEWQTKYEFKMLQRREQVWKARWTLWNAKIESKHHIWIRTAFIFHFVEADQRLFSTTTSFSHSEFTRWPSPSISWNQPTRHSKQISTLLHSPKSTSPVALSKCVKLCFWGGSLCACVLAACLRLHPRALMCATEAGQATTNAACCRAYGLSCLHSHGTWTPIRTWGLRAHGVVLKRGRPHLYAHTCDMPIGIAIGGKGKPEHK